TLERRGQQQGTRAQREEYQEYYENRSTVRRLQKRRQDFTDLVGQHVSAPDTYLPSPSSGPQYRACYQAIQRLGVRGVRVARRGNQRPNSTYVPTLEPPLLIGDDSAPLPCSV